jgi:hypothetical protein
MPTWSLNAEFARRVLLLLEPCKIIPEKSFESALLSISVLLLE